MGNVEPPARPYLPKSTSRKDLRNDSLQLEYPQLLLEVPLHSLLHHSHITPTGVVPNMPPSGNSLSDSWASISDVEYTHDDDSQSEATDTGSLIDASSVQDIHSVNDSGDISEAEEDDMHTANDLSESKYSTSSGAYDGAVQDSTRWSGFLRQSTDTVVVHNHQDESNDEIAISSINSSQSNPVRSYTNGKSTLLPYTAGPAQRGRSLDVTDRPLCVLLLKTKAVTADAESAVLRKIGAAVLAGTSSSVKPTNYHIIPSTFGPGTQPDTSELIPVTKQIVVHNGLLTDLVSGSHCFRLIDGALVDYSQNNIVITEKNGTQRIPDIILSITNEYDSRIEGYAANQAIEILMQIPAAMLVLEEHDVGLSAESLLEARAYLLNPIDHECSEKERLVSKTINITHFLAFESEDVRKHLEILTDIATHPQSGQHHANHPVDAVWSTMTKWSVSAQTIVTKKASEWWSTSNSNSLLGNAVSDHIQNIWYWLTPLRGGLIVVVIGLLQIVMLTSKDTLWQGYNTKAMMTPSGLNSVVETPLEVSTTMHSSSKTSSENLKATPLSKTTDVSLLSGMLHDVAEYWPLQRLVHPINQPNSPDLQKTELSAHGRECGVSALLTVVRRGTTLSLPDEFYSSLEPDFKALVLRGKHTVPHQLEALGKGRFSIKVDGQEIKGLLHILLSTKSATPVSKLCVQVDLQDTAVGSLAGIIDQKQFGVRRKPIKWTLIRIQRESFKKGKALTTAARVAIRTIEAAHTNIEDMFASQFVACYRKSDDCLLTKINRYEQQLANLAHEYQGKVIKSAKIIRDRAGTLAKGVTVRTSQALEEVKDSKILSKNIFSGMKTSRAKMTGLLANKVSEAQDRARRLLRSRRRH